MMFVAVNPLAVGLAAVANMALGFLWYSPILLGNHWIKAMGWTKASSEKAKKMMGPMYAVSFAATIVAAWVLEIFLQLTKMMTIEGALLLGFFVWLGFVATVQVTDVIFGGKSWKLFYINTGYQLAGYLVMSLVLTWMR